ncbi:uncharacterized protein Fot_42120 [Forsythia ovata]|uniref:DUF1985 domain-containing protein n=1 Tax=Forsythia ovata TaxID=205694 RepID=A0ABD1RM23_9LAMI
MMNYVCVLEEEKAARLSFYEFTLITGLNPADEKDYKSQIVENKGLALKYVREANKVTPKELCDAFENEIEDMDNKYKLYLVFIYETVLKSKETNTCIDLLSLDIIDDLKLFNKYLWGRTSFNLTLHIFLKEWKEPKSNYTLWEFPLAIQTLQH